MRAAILQYTPEYLDVDTNLAVVDGMLAGVDTDLVVLPELFASGYFFRNRAELEQVAECVEGGRTTDALVAWARRLEGTIVAGLPERDGTEIYNSAVVATPNGIAGRYRKVHLFYREKELFTPGNLGFPVFDIRTRQGETFGLGVMICFDWYFPEAARSLALGGADVIAHPSNLVRKDCPRSMPIRALENHVFTLTANRCGRETSGEETLTFIGQSVICDPNGHALYAAGPDEKVVGCVNIRPEEARDRQITTLNDLFADRRPDAYMLQS